LVPLGLLYEAWSWWLEVACGLSREPQEAVKLLQECLQAGDLPALALVLFTGALLAPVSEELIFRGFVFGALERRWGAIPAALASSLVFAVFHPPLFTMLPIFVVGALLCYVYHRTGSLYWAMFFHFLFNLSSIVAQFWTSPAP
jgi:membrane protease YdiL (CAAX protease family)